MARPVWKNAGVWSAVLLLACSIGQLCAADTAIRDGFEAARSTWLKNPDDPDAAWQFARAAFDLAEVDDRRRAQIAEEAIDACRTSLKTHPNVAGTHYYLGLNLGQLARTKKLGALKLVGQMERALENAVTLDAKFDYGGPHRTLGLLYRDAPGWPTSIGNRSKAKSHLLKAIELVPEYPDNHLSLIESYVEWGELRDARTAVAAAEPKLREARKRFTGERWLEAWRDWDTRWQKIRRRTNMDLTSPRGKT